MTEINSVDDTQALLALKLERPLFLEGEAGVGKTELGHYRCWRKASECRCGQPRGAARAAGGLLYPANRRMIVVQEPANGNPG
jgi:hypothetical protein